ncbi:hypothetical protein [Scytonema sp. NUACC26]|uniref:hypothetical protein n=1 Tax=Scytonema sp. NUACC26 TaxID=3140176 RepID=UPI0034DC7015
MISRKIKFAFFSIFALLIVSSTAIADSMTINGSGGDYSYEIWRTTDNKSYYLKVWERQSNRQGAPLYTVRNFDSTGEALDYFDCYYVRKSC